MKRSGLFNVVPLLAVGCAQTATPAADEFAGLYRHEGSIAATLGVAEEANRHLVRLEGGVPTDAGAATPADCVIEAHGVLEGGVIDARFGPVETDTFSYGVAQAKREDRAVEIVFRARSAEVVKADIFGYCGLGADFSGRYQKIE